DGTVEEVSFGEVELVLRLARAALKIDSEGFTETEEVIGFIAEAEKASSDSTDTAIEDDRVAVLLFDLEINVDFRLDRLRLHFSIFRFYFVEIAKLIQPLQADIPQRGVKNVAFFHHDFAA